MHPCGPYLATTLALTHAESVTNSKLGLFTAYVRTNKLNLPLI